MERVHPVPGATEDVAEATPLHHRDLMDPLGARPALRVCAFLGGEILPEGPSHRDVRELQAAADREGRERPRARLGEEGELELVPPGLELPELRMRRGPIVPGVDVGATGEDQRVDPVEQGGDGGDPRQRREDHRRAAGRRDGAEVGPVHSCPLPPFDQRLPAGDADPREAHCRTESGKKGQRGSSTRAESSAIPMRGTRVAPTVRLPSTGAPPTGIPSKTRTPRTPPAGSVSSTPNPTWLPAGTPPSTPISRESPRRPRTALAAGPATKRATVRAGMVAGGAVRAASAPVNSERTIAGPATAAMPQAAPSPAGRAGPQAKRGMAMRRKAPRIEDSRGDTET